MESYHIGFFGKRNKGKSSLMNLIIGQNISIVSEIAGTTTDAVKKTIEIPDIGKVVFIDTAGLDDSGELGEMRVNRTKKITKELDTAIVVFSKNNFDTYAYEIAIELRKLNIPILFINNKSDIKPLLEDSKNKILKDFPLSTILDISCTTDSEKYKNIIIDGLKTTIKRVKNINVLSGIVDPKDILILVTPIDSEAPSNRLILPQVQIARQCLDLNASCLLCQTSELKDCLNSLKSKPKLIITDSQAFKEVAEIIDNKQKLTSFSICLAKQKGKFSAYLNGTPYINKLKDGDKILIMESCTHHSSCEDIGRVKLPNLLQSETKKVLEFSFVAALDNIPQPISQFAFVIQCGGCMVSNKQLENRLNLFIEQGIPISNYGMALAYLNGIFDRATEMFRERC